MLLVIVYFSEMRSQQEVRRCIAVFEKELLGKVVGTRDTRGCFHILDYLVKRIDFFCMTT